MNKMPAWLAQNLWIELAVQLQNMPFDPFDISPERRRIVARMNKLMGES